MRGYVPNPSGLNTRKGERGWLERQEAAKAKMAAHIASFEQNRAHAEAQLEKQRLEREAGERRREANLRLRVTCVCCGVGAIPILEAERVLAAFDRSKVDETKRDKAQAEKLTVACPICDGAQVDQEKGERIGDALAALPADYEAFQGHLQILFGIATAQACHSPYSLRVAKGAIWPRRADAVPPTQKNDGGEA